MSQCSRLTDDPNRQSRSQEFESRDAGEILDKCVKKMLAMYRQILRKNQS